MLSNMLVVIIICLVNLRQYLCAMMKNFLVLIENISEDMCDYYNARSKG